MMRFNACDRNCVSRLQECIVVVMQCATTLHVDEHFAENAHPQHESEFVSAYFASNDF